MSDFVLRIGIEGERDFKAALREINQSFKVLGSEMQLVTSQFDKNDKSVQSLTSRNAVLRKEIDTQKDKIDTLKSALDNASVIYESNSTPTDSGKTCNKSPLAISTVLRSSRSADCCIISPNL